MCVVILAYLQIRLPPYTINIAPFNSPSDYQD
jgi:hypothetical protein